MTVIANRSTKGDHHIHPLDKANRKKAVYNEKKIRKSETLQLILLDDLYAQSGSQDIIFQGGTTLRWVYGGMRNFLKDHERRKIDT